MTKTAENRRLAGEIRIHPDGYAFLICDQEGVPDIFVPPRALGGAMPRDRVEVEIRPSRKHRRGKGRSARDEGQRLEGAVVRVLERGLHRLVGRFEQVGKMRIVRSDDPRVSQHVLIPADGTGGAKHGQTVAVQIISYPDEPEGLTGKVIQILGARGEFATEVETVIHHHDLPTTFPPEVETAAAQVKARHQQAQATSKRRDLRSVPFVTIDGETAKDFDDAVAVEKGPHGKDKVWVAIADVSHFVTPDSPIDLEARSRGTSVYFPDRCLPMLPHILSDDLCSLRPGEERFAVVVSFHVDAQGAISDPRYFRALIQSHARLTYTEVHAILDEEDTATRSTYAGQVAMLEVMAKVCRRLRERRHRRGSLNFDLPEPEIVLDIEGGPEAIVKAPRYFAHQMIEELMIAANEVVASYLTRHGLGCIYRLHPEPTTDHMHEFSELLHNLGIRFRFSKPVQPTQLAQVIEQVHGRPEERLVNHTLLRSMQQAYYGVDNIGHFGLASQCYCHFTSPIRRYPDLIVHRLLLAALGATKAAHIDLAPIAAHASKRERIALDAEREMAKVYVAEFLLDHLGESFDGIVAHVTKFGFFVELLDYFVEGLVHRDVLPYDKYHFEPDHLRLIGSRTGRVFQIGDRVRVEVSDVKMEGREVRFRLIDKAQPVDL